MKLFVNDKLVSMIFKDSDELKIYKKYFTYDDDRNAFRNGKYDFRRVKKVLFLKKHEKYYFLYSGFFQEVLEVAKKNNIKIEEFVDKRTKFKHQKKEYTLDYLSKYFPFPYNDHETKTLKRILGVSQGIVKVPTGGGKGDIMSAFLVEANIPTIIVVKEVMLANQIRERAIEYLKEDVGIWTGKKKVFNDKFLVATIGSVKSIPSLTSYKALIIDEVHESGAKQFQDFLFSTGFPIRIGFSATPNKGKPFHFATIRQFMGGIVAEIKAKELMDNKVIAKPKIIFVKTECVPTLDWQSAFEINIAKNDKRNDIISQIVQHFDEPTVIIIQDVKHKQGDNIVDSILYNTDKTAMFISGDSKVDREQVLKDFESKELNVLVGTRILNQGINIKVVKVLINAGGGKSLVQNLQKLGRGVRTIIKDGVYIKESVLIIDFFDEGNIFTERHSEARMKIYKNEGYKDISVMSINELLNVKIK